MKTIKLLLLTLFMTTATGVLNAQSFFDTTPVYDDNFYYEVDSYSNPIYDDGEDYSLFNEVEKQNGILNESPYSGMTCPFCGRGTLNQNGICTGTNACGRDASVIALRVDNPIGSGLLVLMLLSLLYVGWTGRKRLLNGKA